MSAGKKHTCPLCGYTFGDDEYICASCALNKNCKLICCPRCKYTFTDESKIYNFFKKIISGAREGD